MLKAAVLAGGEWQYNLVRYLKCRDYYTYCINPVVSPTTELADKHIPIDVKDEERVYHAIKDLGLTLLVSDQSEITPLPVARLCQRLGLIANKPETIRRYFINKYLMMKHAEKMGVPVPNTIAAWCLDDFADRKYPLVVKPIDSHSSRGFGLVRTPDDLERAWDEVTKFSPVAITQECVSGVEVTIEGFFLNGKHYTLATSRKTHFRAGIASSLRYPSNLSPPLLAEIIKFNNLFVESTDLKFAITHAEYMVDLSTDKFWLIEIAARGGGSNISAVIVPWVSGVDNYGILHDCLTGKPTAMPEIKCRPAILKFYEFPEGMPVGNMGVKESIKIIPNVQDFRFNFTAKDYLRPANSDQTRHATMIVLAEKEGEIDTAIQSAEELLLKEGWQI
jgi:biotin carboxylase